MAESLKKGTRVTGTARSKLAVALGERYEAGESIRSLAASTGRSYGFVHRILTETGITLRGRSALASGVSIRKSCEPSRVCPGRRDPTHQ
jgi:hypothetical protein